MASGFSGVVGDVKQGNEILTLTNFLLRSESRVQPSIFRDGPTDVKCVRSEPNQSPTLNCNGKDYNGHQSQLMEKGETIWLNSDGEIIIGQTQDILKPFVNGSNVFWCLQLTNYFEVFRKILFMVEGISPIYMTLPGHGSSLAWQFWSPLPGGLLGNGSLIQIFSQYYQSPAQEWIILVSLALLITFLVFLIVWFCCRQWQSEENNLVELHESYVQTIQKETVNHSCQTSGKWNSSKNESKTFSILKNTSSQTEASTEDSVLREDVTLSSHNEPPASDYQIQHQAQTSNYGGITSVHQTSQEEQLQCIKQLEQASGIIDLSRVISEQNVQPSSVNYCQAEFEELLLGSSRSNLCQDARQLLTPFDIEVWNNSSTDQEEENHQVQPESTQATYSQLPSGSRTILKVEDDGPSPEQDLNMILVLQFPDGVRVAEQLSLATERFEYQT